MKQADTSVRRRVEGRAIPMVGDDVDTDRIIPARYLREITFETLGQYAFYDERFDAEGMPKPHPMNDPRFKGGSILVVNRNFGCGSSREHAPQSLMRSGVAAFIGESFGEIFSGNCTALGLPAARVSSEDAATLQAMVEADPGTTIAIDLESRTISAAGKRFSFTMPEADRMSLTSGAWDTTAVLLANAVPIMAAAARIPYVGGWKE
jgi:3-isopropylmalate/(R)-2-methylmalate dehydratase small subunit